ncbi:MAG: hypothetical protein ACFE9C_11255, partial [Candidatus Hodarchaeota archaeon]
MGINKNYKRGIFLLILLLTIISGTTLIQNISKNNPIDERTVSTSAPEDFYEINNNATNAYDLTMFELKWLSLINGSGAQWDDDWYKIMVSPGEERLIVKLIFKHIEGDIDLEIYNSTLSVISGSYSTVDGEFIDIIVPSGIYYIRIYYGNMGNNYDLLWDDMNPTLTDDFYEDNDGPGSGYIISGNQGMWLSEINGLGIQGDDDWYEIFINSGYERLIVDCIFSNGSGNIDMDIYNGSYVMVANSWSDNNHEYVDIIVPSSGMYYIRLHYGNGNNTYDLRWDSLVPGSMDDSYEENDDFWSAWVLDPNYYSNLKIINFDEDWFAVYLNPGDIFAVYIYFNHNDGDLQLELYDPDYNYEMGSYLSSSTQHEEKITFTIDQAGEWRIRIFHNTGGSEVNYDLDIWINMGGNDDWMEENDDFWSSWWVNPGYYGGLKIVDYDEDWFHLYLNPGDMIEVYIRNFDHSIGDLELELYNPSFEWKVGSYSSVNQEYVKFNLRTQDESGDWRIRVYRVSGDSFVDVNYDLEIMVQRGREDPYEWNDYPEEAFFLANNEQKWLSEIHGMAIQGSEDWYAIFITPGYQHLVVNVLFNHSYGNIDIALYQVWDKYNINYITGNSSLDDNEHLEVYGLTPGPYVIQIYGDSWGNEYDLWWDDLRTDFRTEDNYEENDIALAAYDLTHEIEYWDDYGIWGKWLRHISDIGIQSDNDWFKINVAAGTQFLQLRVFVLYEYSEAPIGLELY